MTAETDVEAWLDARGSQPPAELLALIRRYVRETDSDGAVHDRLAAAGLAALADVVDGPGDRSGAPGLLAADALLTYACEAALEAGDGALERLTERLDFDHFSRLQTEST